MDASDHAGHDFESLMEMHSAEAALAMASSDSNSTPADVPSRALLVLARLLSFPPEHRLEAMCELVALMAAMMNAVVRSWGPMVVVRWGVLQDVFLSLEPRIHQSRGDLLLRHEAGRRAERQVVAKPSRVEIFSIETNCERLEVEPALLMKETASQWMNASRERLISGIRRSCRRGNEIHYCRRSQLPSYRTSSRLARLGGRCGREASGTGEGAIAVSGHPFPACQCVIRRSTEPKHASRQSAVLVSEEQSLARHDTFPPLAPSSRNVLTFARQARRRGPEGRKRGNYYY